MLLHIRTAGPEDLQRMAAIEAVCFPPEQAVSQGDIEKRIAAYPGHLLLAICQEEVVGYIMGPVIREPYIRDDMFADTGCHDPNGSWQAVFSLAVIPPLQRRGIGGQLIHAMIALARREGRRGITLTCLPDKVGYYASFGFEDRGIGQSVHGGAAWHNMVLPL